MRNRGARGTRGVRGVSKSYIGRGRDVNKSYESHEIEFSGRETRDADSSITRSSFLTNQVQSKGKRKNDEEINNLTIEGIVNNKYEMFFFIFFSKILNIQSFYYK